MFIFRLNEPILGEKGKGEEMFTISKILQEIKLSSHGR